MLKNNKILLNQLGVTLCGLTRIAGIFVNNCIRGGYMWFNNYSIWLNYIDHSWYLCGLIGPPIGGLLTLNHMVKPNRSEGGLR